MVQNLNAKGITTVFRIEAKRILTFMRFSGNGRHTSHYNLDTL